MSLATLGVSVSYSIALRRTVAERDQNVDDLNRANVDLQQAKAETEAALARALEASDREQRQSYAATLARAQREMDQGRSAQAQRRLRELIPAADSADPDPRDFAWHYLWRQSRRDRTVLDDLFPGGTCQLSAGEGVLLGVTPSRHRGGVWRTDRPDAPTLAVVRPTMRFEPWDLPGSEIDHVTAIAEGRMAIALNDSEERDGVLSVVDLSDGGVKATTSNPRFGSETIATSVDGLRLAIGIQAAKTVRLERYPLEFDGRRLMVFGVPEAGTVVFAADQRRIVSARHCCAANDRRLLDIWDVRTRQRVMARDDGTMGPALAVSPEKGGPIATGTLDGIVQLRHPSRGTVIATLPAPEGNDDHRVESLAFSADGKLLAAGYNRRAILWDVAERRRIESIEGLGDWVSSVAFLPEWPGDVALGLGTGEVVIWHTEPIEDAVIPGGHDEEVWGVAFTADGDLATVGGDRRLKLWDGRTGAERRSLGGHEAWPSCLASAPTAGLLASADFDGRLLIWDAKEGRLLHNLQAHEDRIRAVDFSPDGRLIATGGRDTTIRLWDAASGDLVATLPGHERSIRGLAFGPDGRTLASAGEDPAVLLWDVESRRILKRWEPTTHPTCLAISPEGLTIAAGDARGAVMAWDLESGALRTSLPAVQAAEISGLAFSPDGRALAAGGQNGVVSLVDVGMGQVHVTLAGHQGGVNAVAFSPDGRTLASVSHDRTLRLWWAGPPEASGSR
ncbi:WD domain, G-beta repeat [Planctomyces sp. SH-PL62]|nr:WD domain, G-beta repeat [Planctomyces sp. SH-PL62]